METYFTDLATAFVRGRLGDPAATIDDGRKAGLRLHKFKRNTELPRVKRVLGMLRGLAPESLLDLGSGRGTFLWPLLASFPHLPVPGYEVDFRNARSLAWLLFAKNWMNHQQGIKEKSYTRPASERGSFCEPGKISSGMRRI